MTQNIEQLSWLLPYTQNQCNFYNYEIWQAHLAAQKVDRPASLTSDRSSTINQFPNVTEVKIFEKVETYHESPPRDPTS